jgi:hypothetical protein
MRPYQFQVRETEHIRDGQRTAVDTHAVESAIGLPSAPDR